jgi:site-specific recombinase XerD
MAMSNFPEPVDLTHYLSRSTRARDASTVKKFYKYFQIHGIAQLAGGM